MSFISENMLTILVGALILLVFFKLKKSWSYFADRGLPFMEQSWKDIIGTFSFTAFVDVPCEMYEKCQEMDKDYPYVGFFQAMVKPTILVRDPALVEKVFIKDFSYFQNHGFDFDVKTNPLAGHLFNMKGDEWRTLRHKLVPTFTSGKLRGMVPIIEECADKLIEEIQQDPSLQKDTNLKELFKKYSLAVIASTAFGIDPESVKDPNCQFRRVLQEIVTPSFSSRIRFSSFFLFPTIAKVIKLKFFTPETEEFILSLTKDTIDVRKKSGMKRNDFIQLLLELKEKGSVDLDVKDLEQDETEAMSTIQSGSPSVKLDFTEDLLAAQVFVFLVAGFENTAYLPCITMYLLSKHPEIQSRVREEIRECKKNHGGIDYQSLRDMKLLGACIDEALRLYTPITVLQRVTNKAYTFDDGLTVEKGIAFQLPAKSLHRDSRYWPDPDQFKPERFLDGGSIVPGTYFPFGDGPRICIAQRMALLITKLMLAKLMLSYELKPSPKTKEPIKLQVFIGADNVGGFYGSFEPLKN